MDSYERNRIIKEAKEKASQILGICSALIFSAIMGVWTFFLYKWDTHDPNGARGWYFTCFFASIAPIIFSYMGLHAGLVKFFSREVNKEQTKVRTQSGLAYKWIFLIVVLNSILSYCVSNGGFHFPFAVKIERNQ